MRSAWIFALLVLAGCASPGGAERNGCSAEWLEARSVVAQLGSSQEQALPIDCMQPIANRRLRLGFVLPAGPSCHVLSRVELTESADAVSIALFGAVNDDPNAGACPEEPQMVVTEIDLASPVDDRRLLDRSAADQP